MKKTIITIDKLLEEGKYYKQIPCYFCFCMAGIFMFLVGMSFVDDIKKLIVLIIFVGLPFLLPFGYFLGLKKILATYADINKVKKLKFHVYENKCIDKQIVSNKDSSNDTQIIFGENSGAWVSRKKSKEIKVGDVCYVIYLEGDKKPSMIFSKSKYELEETLKSKIRSNHI